MENTFLSAQTPHNFCKILCYYASLLTKYIFSLVDAFSGVIKNVFQEHQNCLRIPMMASFTPESSHVMVGSSDGMIYFYDVESGSVALKIPAPNNQPCHIAEFSPQHFVAATADSKLVRLEFINCFQF